MLTITAAEPKDIADLSERITDLDAAELRAAGQTVEACLAQTEAKALRLNGRLVCLFGAVQHPASPRGGIPWMLCTNTLKDVAPRAMAQISDQVVSAWREQFDSLSNLIHRRNSRAIRFVEWLGFTVSRQPCGPGQEFYVFEWRRDV